MTSLSTIKPHVNWIQLFARSQKRSDDFRALPQTNCLGLLTKGYGDYFFLAGPWRAPSAPRAPCGRGVLATPLREAQSAARSRVGEGSLSQLPKKSFDFHIGYGGLCPTG